MLRELSEPRLMKLNGGTVDLRRVVVAPATGLCQQASVGVFQYQTPGIVLDEQAAVSGGVQRTFVRLLGFPEGASVGGLSYEHGVIGIFFRYDGRGKHTDAEGTFADRFDGERQLWIVVVGRLWEVQRLEGLVQVGVCIECLAGHQLLAFPLDSPPCPVEVSNDTRLSAKK